MLKEKKSLYILIPLTLLIWGLIGYKIYSGLEGDDDGDNSGNELAFIPQTNVSRAMDTFSLFNNYSDPFLKELHFSNSSSLSNKSTFNSLPSITNINLPKNQSISVNDWPSVVFSGTIKNQSNGMTLLLITVNNKTYTAKPGEIIDGLKIVSFSSSDVTLQRGKEKRSFSK